MKLALKIALWWAPVLYLKGVGGTSRSLAGGVGFSQPPNQRNIRRTCWWISRKACSDTECGKNNSIGDPRTPSTPSVHWWNSGTSWKKSSKKTTFCKRPAGGGFVIFLWGESESVLVVGSFDDTSFFVVVLVKDLEANWRILDLFHDVLMNYIYSEISLPTSIFHVGTSLNPLLPGCIQRCGRWMQHVWMSPSPRCQKIRTKKASDAKNASQRELSFADYHWPRGLGGVSS